MRGKRRDGGGGVIFREEEGECWMGEREPNGSTIFEDFGSGGNVCRRGFEIEGMDSCESFLIAGSCCGVGEQGEQGEEGEEGEEGKEGKEGEEGLGGLLETEMGGRCWGVKGEEVGEGVGDKEMGEWGDEEEEEGEEEGRRNLGFVSIAPISLSSESSFLIAFWIRALMARHWESLNGSFTYSRVKIIGFPRWRRD